MPRYNGLTGSPWHVERVHNNDPDDFRRHRSRCDFYIKSTRMCKANFALCAGASHCNKYIERSPDKIQDEDEANYYLPAFNKKQDSNRLIVSKEKLCLGAIVIAKGRKYIIVQADNLNSGYIICKRLQEIRGRNQLVPSARRVTPNLYISSDSEVNLYLSEIDSVSPISEATIRSLKQRGVFSKTSQGQVKQVDHQSKLNPVVTRTINTSSANKSIIIQRNEKLLGEFIKPGFVVFVKQLSYLVIEKKDIHGKIAFNCRQLMPYSCGNKTTALPVKADGKQYLSSQGVTIELSEVDYGKALQKYEVGRLQIAGILPVSKKDEVVYVKESKNGILEANAEYHIVGYEGKLKYITCEKMIIASIHIGGGKNILVSLDVNNKFIYVPKGTFEKYHDLLTGNIAIGQIDIVSNANGG